MREVEIKAKLRDKQAVIEKLSSLGCVLSAPVRQDDTVYAKDASSLQAFNACSQFLRLRVSGDGKVLFTLKLDHERAGGDPHTTPIEHEAIVSSREEMESIILLLGFEEAIRITKERRQGVYQAWEICVDELAGLGAFIEIEQMVGNDADTKPVHDAMLAFLASLGIAHEDMFAKRYDVLMLEKKFETK